jgi:hypothetical protein
MTTFRHMMMLRFQRDVTGDQKQALLDGLAKMPRAMGFIRRYEFGLDLGVGDDTFDFGLIADFDSEEDWRRYQADPDHQILLHNLIRPVMEDLVRVQYEVG